MYRHPSNIAFVIYDIFIYSDVILYCVFFSCRRQADLLPAARAIARDIADNTAPVSVALIRQMMWRMLGASHPMEAHRVDSRFIVQRGMSADVREGVTSFLEKRPAQFPQKVSHDMPPAFPWWTNPEYK
jgi:enoyl-CoA hydratase/carnithine racemase